MKRAQRVGIQYAALPYQLDGRELRIMLISSRRTRRWIIPKGWPMHGLRAHEGAAAEALEEAGILGEISDQPIGSYRYFKEAKGQRAAVQVIVFPLQVSGQAHAFKEAGQRISTWFQYRRAAAHVAEPALRRLILDFGAAHTSSWLVRSFLRYRAWRFDAR